MQGNTIITKCLLPTRQNLISFVSYNLWSIILSQCESVSNDIKCSLSIKMCCSLVEWVLSFGSFSFSERVVLSFPAYGLIVRPKGQDDRDVFSVWNIATSFTFKLFSNRFHFLRTFNVGKYSRKNLPQNMLELEQIFMPYDYASFLRLVSVLEN